MAVWLRRLGEGGGAGITVAAPVASQSVLLLACIRAAAWSPNILFWSFPHAALCAGPALLLQAGLAVTSSERGCEGDSGEGGDIKVLEASAETTSTEGDCEGNGGGGGDGGVKVLAASPETTTMQPGQAPKCDADDVEAAGAPPSRGAVAAASIFLTTLAHFVIYFAPSPSLLVRGSDAHGAPELSTLLPPLILWFASECVAVTVAGGDGGGGGSGGGEGECEGEDGGGSTLTSILADSGSSCAVRAAGVAFALLIPGLQFLCSDMHSTCTNPSFLRACSYDIQPHSCKRGITA